MSCDPRRWSKFWKAPDRQIGKPGENGRKIVAQPNLQPAAAFHDRQNRCNLRSCQWTADVYPILRPRATGRMEFSARLVLSSNSGYSRKRVSFFQSVSAYWQALLSVLEGNAPDCATSILLRITSSRGLALS